jgi:hypothetical protein
MRIRPFLPALVLPFVAVWTLSAQQPPRPGQAQAPPKMALTVDSIMRGPDLVGYPPSGLRWSGDSRDLFFEWRKPGEKEAATYVLSQNTTVPRRLTDEERRLAPPVGGTWDEAHRRVVAADGGDIVVIDTIARTRQQVTRTTAQESGPRWARNDTAVTFVSQNNLFIVPLATGSIEQLTDVKPRRRETRDTDSQTFVRDQEAALLQATREAEEGCPAGIRADRAPERAPVVAASFRNVGVPVGGRSGGTQSHHRAQLRDRVGLHRGHLLAAESGRQPGPPASGGPQPQDTKDRVGRCLLRGHREGRGQGRTP